MPQTLSRITSRLIFPLIVLAVIAPVAQSQISNPPSPVPSTQGSNFQDQIRAANELKKNGRFAEAAKLLENARRQSPDDKSLAFAMADLQFDWAQQLEKQFDFPNAAQHYTAAFDIDKAVRRDRAAIDVNNLGSVWTSAGNFEKAISCYEQSLVIRREVRDRAGEGRTLDNLGNAWLNLSQFERAIPFYQQALVIRREIADASGEVKTLNNLGRAYGNLGQSDKAIGYFEQALAVAQKTGDPGLQALVLTGLGAIYHSTSQVDKAQALLEKALPLARQAKDGATERSILNNLGAVFHSTGRFDKAVEAYEKSLALARTQNNLISESTTLANLGSIYQDLGQPNKAIERYEQALAISRQIQDREGEATILSDLGAAYCNLNDFAKSIPYYQQALDIRRQIKDRAGEGNTLANLGISFAMLNRNQEALHTFQQAREILRQVGDRTGEGIVLDSLGGLSARTGQFKQAVKYHEEALASARLTKDKLGEAGTLANLMNDWKALGKPGQAIFYGKLSVKTWEELRANVKAGESRQSFLQSHADIYRALAELLIAQGRLAEAQKTLDLLKDEEYFQFVRGDATRAESQQTTPLTNPETGWQQRYNQIADRVASIGAQHDALAAKPVLTPPEKEQLRKLERDSETAMLAFQKTLEQIAREIDNAQAASARLNELKESEALMEDLRDLDPGTVAICTLVTEGKYHAIVITPDILVARESPISRVELEKKVRAFRETLQDPRRDPRPQAQELYRILIGPIEQDLAGARAQTLLWSLDGVLRYLPFSALNDGNKYMVERFQNVVFTLASRARLKEQPAPKWRALGLGVSKAQSGFSALPEVPDELHGIIREQDQTAGVLPGKVILDAGFTEDSFKDALRAKYPLVHIASHFQFEPGDENQSFLLLGDGRHLTLGQIQLVPNLFSSVDLLTLSACQTALGGRDADGRELESFGVLAQRKGAKAVIATLWPVADVSTKILMQEFYRRREGPPVRPKAEALREAQLALLDGNANPAGNRYAHPYYWAPFILIGNAR